MSYPQDRRRRVAPAGLGFSSTGRRTLMGYWVPLAITVGVATISIAAWIWSERDEDDDEGEYGRAFPDDYPPPPGPDMPPGAEGADFARSTGPDVRQDDSTVMGRMQGALRRTPSPQQILDGASRRVAAGMAAAGAMVGGALSSIREERGDFEDHSRWSEEADSRARGAAETGLRTAPSSNKKRTVALVVSADPLSGESDDISLTEHASILSHLPTHVNPDVARVFVLIYAPGLKHAIGQQTSTRPTPSVDSSYSNIAHEEAAGAGELSGNDLTPLEPQATEDIEATSPMFKTLYTQAQAIVDKDTMIMPYSTTNGYLHLLRHLSPDIVYIQQSLSGNEGETVKQLSNWVRHVVVVVGDEGGRGGLVDSEDESALGGEHREKWWQKEGVTGIGKHIDVVDSLKIGDDWRRRVSGHD
ncbi:hypothetical protein BGW36DRAFT_294176 [Talaromyces proteolyticus]|uniref:Peroxin 22-like protein n=1 Tax=Talaromyces proteolyticus TaxID=1131652 RepID=A0AAD4KVE1_9EURO|nr:uncharacterized protein BGW36DRAFT_294176 [Talaromyces proteolyticus]KAH8699159.1 hypothetical protein BGW36DRAFT_294176 [Talaromyces proteolyticus]